jgi:aminoglycoside 2'-N-acetyltransferase I
VDPGPGSHLRAAGVGRRLILVEDGSLEPDLLSAARTLCTAAFGDRFSDEDWEHTFGGERVLAFDDGDLVGHAAVVPRTITVGEQPFRAGYVEGVAVRPQRQRDGFGRTMMTRLSMHVRARYELGALSTSRPGFYARSGWERWSGPSYVRDHDATHRTEDEDDGLMALRFGPSAHVALSSSITCLARSGDDW